MSSITRGSRNAFRNPLRTISVTVILGISLGMVLVMLTSRTAVNSRIAEVKSSIGNTVSVSPAGARGFLGGGEPLAQDKIDSLKSLSGVKSVFATIDAQMRTDSDTSLKSSIEAGTLGGRQRRVFVESGDQPRSIGNFTPPIFAIGTNYADYGGEQVGSSYNLTSGSALDASSDADMALVGKSLAEKNNLSAGSTFTAFGKTITVSGIYDAGNDFSNNSVIFPIKTLQRLSSQTDQVTSAVVNVDSVEHMASVVSAVKGALGDAADVTSSQNTVEEAVKPLENIRAIATTSLFGALVAAAVITLLTMVMIVRERRKEIAVLKAIGASDTTIVTQFVTESVALSLVGSVIGMILGFVLSNPILKALLNSSRNNITGPGPGQGGRIGEGAVRVAIGGFRAFQGAIRDVQAVADWHLIAYGLLAAIAVAIIGSAFPAWLIAKVRPSEVLRSE